MICIIFIKDALIHQKSSYSGYSLAFSLFQITNMSNLVDIFLQLLDGVVESVQFEVAPLAFQLTWRIKLHWRFVQIVLAFGNGEDLLLVVLDGLLFEGLWFVA